MNKRCLNIFTILIMILMSLNFANASVEVFSKYNTYIDVNDDYTFDVHKEIYLRNVHDVGIVPGQIEFKILDSDGNGGEVLSYKATNRYGEEIRSMSSKTQDETVILLDIFTPVLPGFEYKIDLKYTIEYESSGFLFKNVQLPLKENTKIPIQTGVLEVSLPESYHITHIDFEDERTVLEDGKVIWELNKNSPEFVNMEYSFLPVGFGGIKGAIIFWLTIDIILIIVLIVEVIGEIKKLRKEGK